MKGHLIHHILHWRDETWFSTQRDLPRRLRAEFRHHKPAHNVEDTLVADLGKDWKHLAADRQNWKVLRRAALAGRLHVLCRHTPSCPSLGPLVHISNRHKAFLDGTHMRTPLKVAFVVDYAERLK